MCKSRANTSNAYHVQLVIFHVVGRDSSAKLDRVKIAFMLLALVRWLKPLTDGGQMLLLVT